MSSHGGGAIGLLYGARLMRNSFSSKIIACVCVASLLLAASPLIALAQNASRLAVASLRCEYLVSPLAVEAREPRLSWMIESTRRGARQTAYHILVASSASLLAANRGDLWDSGKVASNQTIQVAYQGKLLA